MRLHKIKAGEYEVIDEDNLVVAFVHQAHLGRRLLWRCEVGDPREPDGYHVEYARTRRTALKAAGLA